MKNYVIRYCTSAKKDYRGWERESLPIGNSYMGMCVFGDTNVERLQFNQKTLWKGGPSDSRPNYNGGNIKDSFKNLKAVQDALDNNDSSKVSNFANKLIGCEDGYGNYLNFGDILIDFDHKNIENYERGLNLNNSIAYVMYDCINGQIIREHFANFPSNVICSKISTNKKNTLNFKISCKVDHKGAITNVANNEIIIYGALPDNQLKYYLKIAIKTDGKTTVNKDSIDVTGANEAVFFLTSATNYKNEYPTYRGNDPKQQVDKLISNALSMGYQKLKVEHIKDYTSLFERMSVDFGATVPKEFTNQLLSSYKKNNNNTKYLEELLFQYGRNLLINSSRGLTLPANLQGVWNASNNPSWGSDYHLNVNLQMCYWLAYSTNLSECALPMIDYMESLKIPGRVTAKEYHNVVSTQDAPENGWVCHVQNTPFGWTCPGWNFYWGWSPASSSWMLQNCFDYYSYTGDIALLKSKIYPMMKENAKFWVQNLIYNKDQDRYVSSPSYSPEHGPISIGNTYEQEMIYILFNDTIKASVVLGDNDDVIKEIIKIKDKLVPLAVGKWGQIKEWQEEDTWYKFPLFKKLGYKKHSFQNRHRHTSHLLGLFPGDHINREHKEFLKASEVSLLDRGFGGTGWGKAIKINLWARLKSGKHSYEMVQQLISHSIATNLWDLHPPFQLDGNFGLTNGISEMLCYSNDNYIELLPSIPNGWKNGSIKGMCAKGGYILDFSWQDSIITMLKINHKNKTSVNLFANNAISKIVDCKKAINNVIAIKVIKSV